MPKLTNPPVTNIIPIQTDMPWKNSRYSGPWNGVDVLMQNLKSRKVKIS